MLLQSSSSDLRESQGGDSKSPFLRDTVSAPVPRVSKEETHFDIHPDTVSRFYVVSHAVSPHNRICAFGLILDLRVLC
jgi:hypothetical protein